MTSDASVRLPAFFFGHGSPMNALERNRFTEAWSQAVAGIGRPRAILAISAHWFVRGSRVTVAEKPETIHDFGGFPRALHQYEYPAPGDPRLARRVRDLLAPVPVALDEAWGLDHGTWSVLTHAYPAADVPVVQLSLDATLAPRQHLDLARRLAPLRDEGVLIVGSGNVVHNLRAARFEPEGPAYDWAERFEERVRAAALADDADALTDLNGAGADATASAPTPEHYLPMLYAFGQRTRSAGVIVRGVVASSISMLSLRFD